MGKALDESFNKNKKFMIEMQSIQVSLSRQNIVLVAPFAILYS